MRHCGNYLCTSCTTDSGSWRGLEEMRVMERRKEREKRREEVVIGFFFLVWALALLLRERMGKNKLLVCECV